MTDTPNTTLADFEARVDAAFAALHARLDEDRAAALAAIENAEHGIVTTIRAEIASVLHSIHNRLDYIVSNTRGFFGRLFGGK